ncbi:energy-coupling factor transport system permease protein [Acetitomaculum ruminis DSM 5522]|uniref:Energy-coupling factor transport system permease protein n=1 Tax=Acetitomaculum ruminis DSM 5522 TaxID=1120918 RepID=A0A1I0XUX0_9FIRM|nr:energy-coupling factor transporter transmembrane component T [Acetitomaculum ruminis]SFB03773.1 energy-coupling factor transport system permease protein [Acetitomaculum ruminis DSM 5522]
MEDNFSSYHPVISFFFFLFVICVSMFLMHPVFLAISFFSAFSYNLILYGIKKTLKNNLLFILPMMIIIALANPMFNHYGVTVITYLPTGNPVTLETIIYGIAMATMFCEVLLWFACYNEVMTSDKFIYLFGKIMPSISLMISMTLRFVPMLRNHMRVIANGQKCIGRDTSNGKTTDKIKNGVKKVSILTTWALENAIDRADSMRSRGYGLKGRTAFSIYRFDKRDRAILIVMILLAITFFVGNSTGNCYVSYDPIVKVKGIPLDLYSCITFLSYLTFCMLPVIVDLYDKYKWKALRNNINKKENRGYRLWT